MNKIPQRRALPSPAPAKPMSDVSAEAAFVTQMPPQRDDEPDMEPPDFPDGGETEEISAPAPAVALTPAPIVTPPQGVGRSSLRAIAKSVTTRPASVQALSEQKFGKESREIVYFTLSGEELGLHFEPSEPSIKGFFRCPRENCPYCRFGKPATETLLLPVISVEDGDVKTLRHPLPTGRQDARALLPQIMALDDSGTLADSYIMVSSPEKGRYEVEAVPGDVAAMGDLTAVKEFVALYNAGKIFLADTFAAPTVEELNQVPWVRRKLEIERLRGGRA